MQPLANSLGWHPHQHLNSFKPCDICEKKYPLRPVICQNGHCGLVQLPALDVELFGTDYPYRSGQSASWITHLHALVAKAAPAGGTVVEVGGNDGSLGKCLPLGCEYINVDPTADFGEGRALRPWIRAFMSRELGQSMWECADWIVANNVAAHVPDLDDFFAGIRAIMKPTALLTVEVQDVEQMIRQGAWDCIYHEHYTYFSRSTLADVLERRGFFVERIEDIPTHGGSLRAYARRNEVVDHPLHQTPLRIMKPYPEWGLGATAQWPWELWKSRHDRVVGYGAPAKATVFCNALHLDTSYIECIIDSTPGKQGKFLPGAHIPIVDAIDGAPSMADIVVILAWNWADEILPKIPEGPEVWCRGVRLR